MSADVDAVEALERGEAYVDLSSWWAIAVQGADAHGWLNDLLSAELDGIAPGEARTSFLLTPTGRIRAVVAVTMWEGGYLLVQDPSQPTRIDTLLDPYVLSSDVKLEDRRGELELISIPGASRILSAAAAPEGHVEAGPDDLETWRIRRGVARFGADLTTESLPHEVEIGDTIAFDKGCFLGQEAVAKVRNLGHPPFVLLAGDTDAVPSPADVVWAGEEEAGTVTSAAASTSGGTAVIVRVRWALKDEPLQVSARGLRTRGLASAP